MLRLKGRIIKRRNHLDRQLHLKNPILLDELIPYAQPSIEEIDICAVKDALESKQITRGPFVEKFEQALSAYCDVKHTICFNSGTTALQAAYFAAQIQENDTVYTSPNTFIATILGAVERSKVQLIDVELDSGNLSTSILDLEMKKKNAGRNIIVPVHFSGIPVDLSEKYKNRSKDLLIIEDAAHALGGAYKNGQKIGSCQFSDMTIFSFHPAKSITTGEGGAVTTNNTELFRRLSLFRNNGMVRNFEEPPYPGYYEIRALTGNYNFTDFQAALGLSQLARLDSFIEKRRSLVSAYRKRLEGFEELKLFSSDFDSISAHHLFVVQIDFEKIGRTRKEVMEVLRKRNIGTQLHYIPLYRHPAIANHWALEDFPLMEIYYRSCLTLPLFPSLTIEQVHQICDHFTEVLGLQ